MRKNVHCQPFAEMDLVRCMPLRELVPLRPDYYDVTRTVSTESRALIPFKALLRRLADPDTVHMSERRVYFDAVYNYQAPAWTVAQDRYLADYFDCLNEDITWTLTDTMSDTAFAFVPNRDLRQEPEICVTTLLHSRYEAVLDQLDRTSWRDERAVRSLDALDNLCEIKAGREMVQLILQHVRESASTYLRR